MLLSWVLRSARGYYEAIDNNGGKKEKYTDVLYAVAGGVWMNELPERKRFVRPEYFHIAVLQGIYKDVEPNAKDTRYYHFAKCGFIVP